MTDPTAQQQPALEPVETVETDEAATAVEGLVDDELLVEDVSIDGMCGVY